MAEIDKMLIKLLRGVLIGGFFIVVLFMYFKHDSDINTPTPDSLRIVTRERDEYKALYLKCNGVISTTNEQGKFDSDGKLK